MNEKSLRILEYDKIIAMLCECATSAPGRKLCAELLPSSDLNEITLAQRETSDACARIRMRGQISFGDTRDITGVSKVYFWPISTCETRYLSER